METVRLAKLLILAPWIASVFMVGGIYATCIDDKWSLRTMYDYSISSLGGSTSHNRGIFAVGFSIASLILIGSVFIKFHLMSTDWQKTASMKFNLCLTTIGSLMLVLMAWSPDDLYGTWTLHFIGAFGGISLLLISQSVDSVHWYQYCKHKQSVDIWTILLSAYSTVCVLSSAAFFGLWTSDLMVSWPEWLGFMFIVLGYMSQSVHGCRLYRFARDENEFANPLTVNM